MRRAFPATRALAVVAAAGLTLSACNLQLHRGAASAPKATASATATPAFPVHRANGFLKIGTLLPETGSLVILGPPQLAGAKLALADINNAGGVLGKPVQMESSDSGDSKTDIASQSVNRLLNDNVSVILGAAASSVTLNVIDKITGSGVLEVSASNTSTKLSDYPAHGLFFRTAPSDIYQGRVVGETALNDGAQSLGILALQDAYGTSLADQAAQAFTDGGGTVKVKKIYDPTASEFSAEVAEIKTANPDAIALIGFDESSKILGELVKQGLLPLSKSKKHLYLVDGNMSNTIAVPKGTLEGVKGTIPGSKPSTEFQGRLKTVDPNLKDFSYAGEAYDAVTLVALATEEAKSDAGPDIATHMQNITTSGTECHSFADCDKLIQTGVHIHYMGQSGPIDFDAYGNPTVASMGIYEFGADNTYKPLKFVSGPVAGGPARATGAPFSGFPGSPSTSAPFTGSPSTGAPFSSGPSNGAPYPGGPSNGAPYNGGPSNGGPFTSGTSNGPGSPNAPAGNSPYGAPGSGNSYPAPSATPTSPFSFH
jgi:branched-chain amino acid transport system substrate-binding protein